MDLKQWAPESGQELFAEVTLGISREPQARRKFRNIVTGRLQTHAQLSLRLSNALSPSLLGGDCKPEICAFSVASLVAYSSRHASCCVLALASRCFSGRAPHILCSLLGFHWSDVLVLGSPARTMCTPGRPSPQRHPGGRIHSVEVPCKASFRPCRFERCLVRGLVQVSAVGLVRDAPLGLCLCTPKER